MPQRQHTYHCTCVIHPDGHYLQKSLRLAHNLEIKSYQDKALETGLPKILASLSLDDPPSPGSSLQIISIDVVQAGIEKILEARFQRPSQPSTIPLSQQSEPLPLSMHDKKQLLLLDALDRDIEHIANSIDPVNVSGPNLDTAANLVRSCGISLADSALKNPASENVCTRKRMALDSLRRIDSRISQLGALLPKDISSAPVFVDSARVLINPVSGLDVIAQVTLLLGFVVHFMMGLSGSSCDFIISVATMLIRMAMSSDVLLGSNTHNDVPTSSQSAIIQQLPTSLHSALSKFDLDGKTIIYAACPTCNLTHRAAYDPVTTEATYPDQCTNEIINGDGRRICGSSLLEDRNGSKRPIKPFVSASFQDYLSRTLADPQAEHFCKKACDDAFHDIYKPAPQEPTNIFESTFMRTFEGPIPGQLFIDRGNSVRLAFAMHVDFFNASPNRCSATESLGIITLANMNLPHEIRYSPEFLFLVGIIPGPQEPPLEELNHYIRPIIDEMKIGWTHGYHISRTADSPDHGERVDTALVLSINDLPAARKVSGTAGASANIYCTVCNNRDRATLYHTNFGAWTKRDSHLMRQQAEAWRDAETLSERAIIKKNHGMRWSELWQLPYWDPTRMLVVDSMHCILEGIVHYHCRYVLRLDSAEANATDRTAAFSYPWTNYDDNKNPKYQGFETKERKQITAIQTLLERPHGLDPDPLNETQLRRRLLAQNKNPLAYVAYDVGLHDDRVLNNNGVYASPSMKEDLVDLLVKWRLQLPLLPVDNVPKTCDQETLSYIQHVIKYTDTLSWIHSVPLNYGEAAAGIIKAGEWHILSTIYIPIALTTLWGDQGSSNPSHFLPLLDHSMALFEAVILLVRDSTSASRASKFRMLLKQWVDDLHALHPHTTAHHKRVNIHVAFHLYDFLQLFGPVPSWWTFPFERLIGTLRLRVNTNNKIGGPLEQTILETYTRGANLRRWLRRSDCPEVIRQFKMLLDKAFPSRAHITSEPSTSKRSADLVPTEVAHYRHNGVNFSQETTHVGNSLILYYPTSTSVVPIAGSIQKITTSTHGARLYVRRQVPLTAGQWDPFKRYPSFPAQTYSSNMDDTSQLDVIGFQSVVSHVARYVFKDRAVILNLSGVSTRIPHLAPRAT